MSPSSSHTPQAGYTHASKSLVRIPRIPANPPSDTDAFFQQEDITNLTLGDIIDDDTIELSPIFNVEAAFASFDKTSLRAMLPVFRLASVILKSPRAVRFLHTIFFGTLHQDTNGSSTLVEAAQGPLTKWQLQSVDFAIQELSKVLTYAVGSFIGGAETEKVDSARSVHFQGTGSQIILSGLQLKQFSQAWRRHTKGATSVAHTLDLLPRIFKLLTTLVHEIGHAAWYLRSSAESEPFMNEFGSVGELGYAFEAVVFGGIIDRLRGRPRLHFVIAPNGKKRVVEGDFHCVINSWPIARIAQHYVDDKHAISMRGNLSGFLDVTQRIWMADLVRRCTQAYWHADTVGIIDHVNVTLPICNGPSMVRLADSLSVLDLTWKTQAIKQIAGNFETFARGTFGLKQVDRQQIAIEMARRAMKPELAQQWVECVERQQAAQQPMKPIPASASKSRLDSKQRPSAKRGLKDKDNRPVKHTPAAIKQYLAMKRQDLHGRPPLAVKGKLSYAKSGGVGRRRAAPAKPKPNDVIDLTFDITELRDLLQKTLQVPVFIAPELGLDFTAPELDPATILLRLAEDSDVEMTG